MAFLDSWFSLVVSVASAGIIVFVLRTVIPFWRRYKLHAAVTKDIGCEPPHWFFGHLQTFQPTEKSLKHGMSRMKSFPKCSPVWLGPFNVFLQCFDSDLFKAIMSTEEPKDDVAYRFLRPWVGDGLLTSSGAKWKRNRRLLTPAFHFEVLKRYLVCMNASVTELLKKWSNMAGVNEDICVEMFSDIGQMTLDNLLRCILSKESGCQQDENDSYLKAVKDLSFIAIQRFFNPLYYFDCIFYLSPLGRKYKRSLKVAHDYTEAAIKERKAAIASGGRVEELDFLDILLKAKDERGVGLSHQEICDEVDTFVFEGHDTVSSGLSWAFYNLAAYPEYQERCRREVFSVLGDETTVRWEDLPKLKYLTMFIKESMRLYPPVLGIGRKTTKPFTFSRGFGTDQYNTDPNVPAGPNASKTFPENFNLLLNIMFLHRNPNVWESPDVFDPERFTQDSISKRSPHAYVPFSSGPRNCIGQNFAMNEVKVTLALALMRFRVKIDNAYEKPEMAPDLIVRSKNGIHLKLEMIER